MMLGDKRSSGAGCEHEARACMAHSAYATVASTRC